MVVTLHNLRELVPCAACRDRRALCGRCVRHWMSIYSSEALYRGRDWGLRVIQQVAPADRVAWPGYAGSARTRARARALVVDVAGGDEGVLDALAQHCAAEAGGVYEGLRAMGSTGVTLLPSPAPGDAPTRPGPTASTGPCPGCRERVVRCDACVRAWAAVHATNAAAAGRSWGASAMAPQHPYDKSLETRAAAQRRIRALAGSDPRTIDSLARICADAAIAVAGAADAGGATPPAT